MEKYFNVNSNGCSISCKLYADDPSGVKNVILFGHGFGGNKDNKSAEKLAKRIISKNKGVALVIFNWPCHGDDVRKTLRLEDCMHYLSLVLAWVEQRWPGAALYAYATSFGGYLFLRYLADNPQPFRKIALRCPAVNMFDVLTRGIMGPEEWKRIEKGKSVEAGFDRKVEIDRHFLDSIREADITRIDYMALADQVLILQGTKDELVSFEAVRRFAEENLMDFVPVEGADHRFLDPAKMGFAIQTILDYFGMR